MPDLTREEAEAIIARAEAATESPLHVENDHPWHDVLTPEPEMSNFAINARFWYRDDADFYVTARANILALAAQALRQMDEMEAARKLTAEIRHWEPCGHYGRYDEAECQVCVNVSARGRLVIERDHWRGVVVEVQSDAAVAESNCDALTADLAAVRAAIERVAALADRYDEQSVYTDFRGDPMNPAWVAAAIRATLHGEEG